MGTPLGAQDYMTLKDWAKFIFAILCGGTGLWLIWGAWQFLEELKGKM